MDNQKGDFLPEGVPPKRRLAAGGVQRDKDLGIQERIGRALGNSVIQSNDIRAAISLERFSVDASHGGVGNEVNLDGLAADFAQSLRAGKTAEKTDCPPSGKCFGEVLPGKQAPGIRRLSFLRDIRCGRDECLRACESYSPQSCGGRQG